MVVFERRPAMLYLQQETFMEKIKAMITSIRSSKTTTLLLVFLTNALDNLLLTVVVPIIPGILMQIDSSREILQNLSLHTNTSTGIPFHKSHYSWEVHNKSNLNVEQHGSVSIVSENSKTGMLLASKALIQIVFNPVAGYISNRLGNSLLLISGTIILSTSSLVYSFAVNYGALLCARLVQGIGSACSVIAGLSLVAEMYQNDRERSKAIGVAMGGIAVGVLVGYPYGSILYAYTGKIAPFLTLFALFLFVICLQIWTHKGSYHVRSCFDGTPMYKLLWDPYILVALAIIMISTMSMANLEPTVPIWIIETMKTPKWQLGLVFLPDSIGYLIGTKCFPVVAKTIGRWICSLVSMLLISLCLFCMPFATNILQLVLPHFGLGLGLGIIDASVFPLLALLIDLRHETSYGSVYAIAQLAVCLAYGIGPLLAGHIVREVSFKWFIWGMAAMMVGCSPISLFLRKYSVTEEEKPILGSNLDYKDEDFFSYKSLHEED